MSLILVDTSALIACAAGDTQAKAQFRQWLGAGEQLRLPAVVMMEWWRGPRTTGETQWQEAMFPSEDAFPFEMTEARIAAGIYRRLARPRGREVDIMIAACALRHEAGLWTLNRADFEDIPELRLVS